MHLPLAPFSTESLFLGKPGDRRLGSFVKLISSEKEIAHPKNSVVILGNPDDLGVRLNGGRSGAAEGPNSIRDYFYKMVYPQWENLELYDLGNTSISKEEILATHKNTETTVKTLSETGAAVISLGGGHDFSAPNFLGMQQGNPKKKWGLINIDPHLDVRPWVNELPNSGTGFRTILESKKLNPKHFIEFGARKNRNSTEHFKYLEKSKAKIIPFEYLKNQKKSVVDLFEKALKHLTNQCDSIVVSFDMDCCSDTVGVSAPQTIGFSAFELSEFARICGNSKKVQLIEIAEVSPPLDPNKKSSQIAAEIMFSFLESRNIKLTTLSKKARV